MSLSTLFQDFRFALRVLAKAPGFTAAAVIVLALGIGLNTAMFSAVYALAFSPRAFPAPDRIVQIFSQDTKEPSRFRGFSYTAYRDLKEQRDLFAGVLAQNLSLVGVGEGADSRRAYSAIVSANFFEVLGVPLARGRSFTAGEETPGADQTVVVVSHRTWRDSGFHPEFLGSSLRINGRHYTVIGITPEGFTGTNATLGPEFYFPLGVFDSLADGSRDGPRRSLERTDVFPLLLVGRLQSGVTSDAAGAALAGIAANLERVHPVEHKDQTFIVGPLPRFISGSAPADDGAVGYIGVVFLGLTSMVLLVVALNLAGLLLVRGHARRKEFAIRVALGGTRIRLVSQLLTEGFVLAVAGGALGCVCALAATKLLLAAIAGRLPVTVFFTEPSPAVLIGATLGFCAMATLFFALGPALTLARRDLVPDLQQNAGEDARRSRRWLPRHPLVVVQIALSLALVIGAGLFARTVGNTIGADTGIDANRTLVVEFDANLTDHDRERTLGIFRNVGERLATVPGIESVGISISTPYSLNGDNRSVRRAGLNPATEAEGLTVSVPFNAVGADYFATLEQPLLRGRAFTRFETDHTGAPPVAIIDQALAARLWPGEDALGQHLEWAGSATQGTTDPSKAATVEIVGITRTAYLELWEKNPPGAIYIPFAQGFARNVHFFLRSAQAGETALNRLRDPLRQELRAAAPDIPFFAVSTFLEHKDASLEPWLLRRTSTVATVFGAFAGFIAVIGLYGTKAYAVSRRTREIGIRLALGADPVRVRNMLLREGLTLGLFGLSLGLLLGAALGRLFGSVVTDLDGFDPLVFSLATFALFAAALIASWLPARQATRVSPLVALRTE